MSMIGAAQWTVKGKVDTDDPRNQKGTSMAGAT